MIVRPRAFVVLAMTVAVSCSSEDASPTGTSEDVGTDAAIEEASVDSGALDSTTDDSAMLDTSMSTDDGAPTETATSDAADAAPLTCASPALGSLVAIFVDPAEAGGATIAFEGCEKTTTASTGAPAGWNLSLAMIPSWFRITKTGFLTTLSGEVVPGSFSNFGLELVSTKASGFVDTKAHVLVRLVGETGTCTRVGNTLSLAGHPEAVVHYLDKDAVDVGAKTNFDAYAWFTNVTPGGFATPTLATSAVAGCKITPNMGTGRAPLVAGTVASMKFLIGS